MFSRSTSRCVVLTAIAACLVSSLNAQSSQIIVPAANVTASANDGNVPANTVDNNLGTRWSASGDPQWIRFDMGSTKTVDYVKIAFYKGDERRAKFDVQISSDGTNWATIGANLLSSGVSLALETFDVGDASGRYLRINGHGTDVDLWNSYTEVQIWGYTGAPPAKLTVASVTASANDGNVPANAIDGSLATRWSASGDPQWIKLNLGSSVTIAYVKIAFYKGNERRAKFDVAVSANDSTYTNVLTNKESSGTSLALETFEFANNTGQWVKITGHGTNTDLWNSYTEVEIWGYSTPQVPPVPTGLAANAVSSSQINVSWNAASGATGYDLMVDGNVIDVGAALSYQHTGLSPSTQHSYQVRAKNATGSSAFSSTVLATTLSATAPATPTGLAATVISSSQIDLSWNASTGATSYDLERDGIAVNVGTSLTYSHTGLSPSTTHNYRVRANNANGSSAWSSIVSATTQAGSSLDPLGIKKLYADSTRSSKAADWYMGIGSYTSRLSGWTSIGSFSGTGANTVYTRNTNLSSNIRMSIYGENTLSSCDSAIEDNKTTLMSRLYMYKPSDWRNIEFTGYFMLDSGGNDTMGAYTHGASHSDGCGCHGTAYKGDFMYSNGGTKINKEIYHGGPNVYRTITTQNVGSQLNKWFGYKFIVYNLPQNGTYSGTSVARIPIKIEVWLDINLDSNGTPKNNWIKVGETTDQGDTWGSTSTNCGGKDFWTMPWGGPNVTIRIDKDSSNTPYGHFILHHCSLREIDPVRLP
jgi:hypothetical protein